MLALRSRSSRPHPPEEVFIVCDGCDDGTQEAARALDDPRVSGAGQAEGAWRGLAQPQRRAGAGGRRGGRAGCPTTTSGCRTTSSGSPRCTRAASRIWCSRAACWSRRTTPWRVAGFDWSIARFRKGALETGRHETPSSAVSHTIELGKRAGGWRTVDSYGDKDFWHRMLRAGARTSMLTEPTVLFFRAWDRDQPYEDRVRQNARLPRAHPGSRRAHAACARRWRGRRMPPRGRRRADRAAGAPHRRSQGRGGVARARERERLLADGTVRRRRFCAGSTGARAQLGDASHHSRALRGARARGRPTAEVDDERSELAQQRPLSRRSGAVRAPLRPGGRARPRCGPRSRRRARPSRPSATRRVWRRCSGALAL